MLRKLILLIVSLFVFTTSTAIAATPRQQIKTLQRRNAQLAKTNKQLRKTNAELSTQNNSLTSQLAQAQTLAGNYATELTRAQGLASDYATELSHTQVLLGTAVQERTDLKNERDSLQNQIDSTPTELTRAVSTVQAERTYLEHLAPSTSDGYLISTAAMNYVVGHVLAGVYGYRVLESLAMPWNAENALIMQAGICGTAAFTFAAIVRQFDLPVRSVQFYYGTNNHIADEVFYNNAWHYFDPTWGAVFSNNTESALSIDQARSGTFQLQRDQTLLWGELAPDGLSNLSVLTDPSTTVEIGKDAL